MVSTDLETAVEHPVDLLRVTFAEAKHYLDWVWLLLDDAPLLVV